MDLPVSTEAVQEPVEVCIAQASDRYDVPDLLIKSILHVESRTGQAKGGRVGDKKPDGGGYALGPMQINTLWLKELAKYELNEADIKDSLCMNVMVGTWILRGYYEHHNQDWTKAVMSYNAGFRLENGRPYAVKVITHWHSLFDKHETAKLY